MKIKIKGLGPRAIKNTILAAMLLGSVHTAHAAMYLTVDFDGVNTNYEFEGTWDVFVVDQSGVTGGGAANTRPDGYTAHLGGAWDRYDTGMTVSVGSAMPNTTFAITSGPSYHSFHATRVLASSGYTAGDLISGKGVAVGDVFD